MAARAPKQWALTCNETITSFINWRQNLLYILLLDNGFQTFLTDGATWQKKSAAHPNRGFVDDGDAVVEPQHHTAVQKSATLELMLGQISRNSIIKGCTSLPDIWQKIRQHYGFQSSGAHFLDLASFKLYLEERPEDLFHRLTAFFEDNLLSTTCGISHHSAVIDADKELTTTLENTIVVL